MEIMYSVNVFGLWFVERVFHSGAIPYSLERIKDGHRGYRDELLWISCSSSAAEWLRGMTEIILLIMVSWQLKAVDGCLVHCTRIYNICDDARFLFVCCKKIVFKLFLHGCVRWFFVKGGFSVMINDQFLRFQNELWQIKEVALLWRRSAFI